MRLSRRRAVGLLLVGLSGGCAADSAGPSSGTLPDSGCVADAQCAPHRRCDQGLCVARACSASSPCPTGYECADDECRGCGDGPVCAEGSGQACDGAACVLDPGHCLATFAVGSARLGSGCPPNADRCSYQGQLLRCTCEGEAGCGVGLECTRGYQCYCLCQPAGSVARDLCPDPQCEE